MPCRGVVSQHALQVVSQHALQEQGLVPGGVWSQGGVWLPEEVSAPQGVSRPTPNGEVEGNQVQAHTQDGN